MIVTYRVRQEEWVLRREDSRVSVSRYAPGSHYESCPAATGETWRASGESACGTYPDSAHRCRHPRDPHYRHACLCGEEWISLTADGLTDPEIRAILHPARHQA